MKSKILLTISLSMFLATSACEDKPEPEQEVKTVETDAPKTVSKKSVKKKSMSAKKLGSLYDDKANGFALRHPKNWEKKQGQMGSLISFFSPVEGKKDIFREGLVVTKEKLPKKMSVKEYKTASMPMLKKVLTDFKEIKSGSTKGVNGPVPYMIYQHRMGQIKMKNVAWFYMNDKNEAFVLTATSEPKKYKKYFKQFSNTAKSFEVK